MIKKLKKHMIFFIMFFVTIIIAIFLFIINYIPYQQSFRDAMTFMRQIHNEDFNNSQKTFKRIPFNNKNQFSHANLIIISTSKLGVIESYNSNSNLYSEQEIYEIAHAILMSNKKEGIYNHFYFTNTPKLIPSDGSSIVLLDNYSGFSNLKNILIISIIAGIIIWVLFLFCTIILINHMTKPIKESFEKQQRFISDAGHELKTPLTVISANIDVLEDDIGKSKWLSYIKTETKRMSNLVQNLMTLAQMDDMDKNYTSSSFDISHVILETTLPYESLAFENGMHIKFDIESNIFINANKEQIQQLITILMSNAIKYGDKNGLIKVTLKKNLNHPYMSVYNTGIGISPSEREKIFDRFYRVEKERNCKSCNYGLGLSIALAITKQNNCKINVQSEYKKYAEFTIIF